ncbi:MAG: hypothetical protein EBR30_26710 [Cytophagia bacterium]|nr:hypothetical protein [Cytophagia bacterium]NBW38546.1 hypothetical protein [Cytophagia bacterium]
MRKLFILTLIMLCAFQSVAQFAQYPQRFVEHLITRKLYDEAILVLHQKKLATDDYQVRDSADYWLGKTYYYLQQLDSSIHYLDRVSNASSFLYEEAQLFSAFNESYSGRFSQGLKKVNSITTTKPDIKKLMQLEQGANYLLLNDIKKYDSLIVYIDRDWRITQQQWINMGVYRNDLATVKKKSPWVGGVLSAILPGAGKIYAGRKGNGVYTFLVSGLMAAQSIEAYRKDGLKSARFIIYGSLFTSFYIGNIWGSTLAVKVVKNEKRDAIRQQILFDMHIPLRTFYQ